MNIILKTLARLYYSDDVKGLHILVIVNTGLLFMKFIKKQLVL